MDDADKVKRISSKRHGKRFHNKDTAAETISRIFDQRRTLDDKNVDSLSAKNDRSRNDLSTLRYLSIQAEGTGPENNEYAPVMRLNAIFCVAGLLMASI